MHLTKFRVLSVIFIVLIISLTLSTHISNIFKAKRDNYVISGDVLTCCRYMTLIDSCMRWEEMFYKIREEDMQALNVGDYPILINEDTLQQYEKARNNTISFHELQKKYGKIEIREDRISCPTKVMIRIVHEKHPRYKYDFANNAYSDVIIINNRIIYKPKYDANEYNDILNINLDKRWPWLIDGLYSYLNNDPNYSLRTLKEINMNDFEQIRTEDAIGELPKEIVMPKRDPWQSEYLCYKERNCPNNFLIISKGKNRVLEIYEKIQNIKWSSNMHPQNDDIVFYQGLILFGPTGLDVGEW